ncbi:MAG: apolipoprotein N-acyltransferase [Alphaproteobacteria bacterium]|nr:apolipoprotein N-acyltransferase [Alphaproteobacteria bacterium]
MKITKWKRNAFVFLLGAVTTLGFAPYFMWPVVLVTTAFLFYFVNQVQIREAVGIGFSFGAGLGAVSMHWLTNALMIDGGQFWFFCPLVWLGFGMWFGLFWGATAGIAALYPAGIRRWLAFTGAFVILEWVRSWLFTGFPWNPLGNIWDYSAVLQIASVAGVYGLSGITLLTFTAFSLGIRKRFLWIMVGIFMALTGLGALRLISADNANVWGTHLRIVQPNIPQTLKWNSQKAHENTEKIIRLSRQKSDGITHILWPETAVPFVLNVETDERLNLMRALPQSSVLITGAMRETHPALHLVANSIFVLDDLTNIHSVYDKSHLVPFGEYMPFRKYLPLQKIVPITADLVAGNGVATKPVLNTLPASLLVCYEVIFSGAVVDKTNRPVWIFNATNDGWYGLSNGPYQHLAMARMRAVEEGLPLVRAANTGISAIIDPYGRIVKSLPLGTEGVLDGDLPAALPPTFYAQGGVWIPLGLALALLILAIKFPAKKQT